MNERRPSRRPDPRGPKPQAAPPKGRPPAPSYAQRRAQAAAALAAKAAAAPTSKHDVEKILPAERPAPLAPPAGFAEKASGLGIEFEGEDLPRLGSYLALLMAANESMNLTAIKDAQTAWSRHVLDSLGLLAMLAELPEGARVIDVGSGGGLPGIPLAICMPHLQFTLLEATGKKAAFLERTARLLGLSNVTVLHDRAERAAHDRGKREERVEGRGGTREAFDAVVARAVGRLNTLAELTVPFAKIGGHILLVKGEKAAEELAEAQAALRMLNAVYVDTVETPTSRVIVLEKNSATPKIYPRADGEPTSRPLGAVKERPAKGPGTRNG